MGGRERGAERSHKTRMGEQQREEQRGTTRSTEPKRVVSKRKRDWIRDLVSSLSTKYFAPLSSNAYRHIEPSSEPTARVIRTSSAAREGAVMNRGPSTKQEAVTGRFSTVRSNAIIQLREVGDEARRGQRGKHAR
jgi:hypothetical protein